MFLGGAQADSAPRLTIHAAAQWALGAGLALSLLPLATGAVVRWTRLGSLSPRGPGGSGGGQGVDGEQGYPMRSAVVALLVVAGVGSLAAVLEVVQSRPLLLLQVDPDVVVVVRVVVPQWFQGLSALVMLAVALW